MKIQSITFNTPFSFNKSIDKNNKDEKINPLESEAFSNRLVDDTGRLNEAYRNHFLFNAIGQRQLFYKFIFAPGRVQKDDLEGFDAKTRNDIVKRAKKLLDITYLSNHRVEPEVFAKAGVILKDYFDKTYGEDKYRIISLGTSPAVAAQAMDYLGVETKYVPVSGIHEDNEAKITDEDVEYYLNKPNMDVILGYIESLGFKKDDKVNVVLDYTITRRTLDIMIECLKRRFNLDDSEIKGYDVVEAMDILGDKDSVDIDEQDFNDMVSMMAYQEVESVCSVPHFYIDDSINLVTKHAYTSFLSKDNTLFEKFNKYSTAKSRAFSLVLLDEVKKLQYAKKKSQSKASGLML